MDHEVILRIISVATPALTAILAAWLAARWSTSWQERRQAKRIYKSVISEMHVNLVRAGLIVENKSPFLFLGDFAWKEFNSLGEFWTAGLELQKLIFTYDGLVQWHNHSVEQHRKAEVVFMGKSDDKLLAAYQEELKKKAVERLKVLQRIEPELSFEMREWLVRRKILTDAEASALRKQQEQSQAEGGTRGTS